ncbi:MAG: hypothetical protein IJ615_04200 [Bacteroidaceae bacterium]|nr:hypothetical protein [Bacteroidaceae bacterium]
MKKTYQLPTMRIVMLQHTQMLCGSGDPEVNVTSNVGITGGNIGSTQAGRVNESSGIWDNEW